MRVLMLLSVLLFLASCGTRTVYVQPESALTVDMAECAFVGDTWRELAEAYLECKSTVKEGNRRFKAIRTEK